MPKNTKADYYVSTLGNDNWSGTLASPNMDRSDGPFASVAQARDAVRTLEKKGDRRVLVRGGTYYLSETVIFGVEDGAPTGHTVTYEAYPGERPVFSSGIRIGSWSQMDLSKNRGIAPLVQGNIWVADVPRSLGRFYTLYDGAKRLPRARTDGFVPTKDEEPWDQINGWNCLIEGNLEPFFELGFPEGAVRNWSNLEDVEVVIIPEVVFTMNILPLESVDEKKGIARTAIPGGYPLRKLMRRRLPQPKSVWIENVLEGLDSPGEWVLNTQEGKLYLWPLGDEPGETIFAPCLRELFRIEGDVDVQGPKDRPVRGIVLRDLTFTQGDRGVVTKHDVSIQHDWEMVDKDDSLVRLRGAEECAVEDCTFTNSGASAVRLDLHCQRNRVTGNEINHLGGAGILLIGYGPGTKDVNRQNEIAGNHIHHNGLVYFHSHGIVMWQSGGNHVAHNSIHHMPRKGICLTGVRPLFFDPERTGVRECTNSIRWHEIENADEAKACGTRIRWHRDWDVREWPEILPYLHTKDNIVEDNEIYRVAQVLGDGGCINISGAGDGNIIRRNFIHHILNPYIHGAIRTDDFQRLTHIEENVIYKTNSCGLCLRHENYAVNNMIVSVRPGAYIWIGERPFDRSKITGNICFHPGAEQEFFTVSGHIKESVFAHLGKMKSVKIEDNVFFNAAAPGGGAVVDKLTENGYEHPGAYADPLFEDWENGNLELKPDSPVLKMGIKPIDLTKVGLRGWK
jgi:hypothetical protein